MARELGPKGIHVAHFIIDGGIAGTRGSRAVNEDDVLLSPQAIAEAYLNVHKQHRSASAPSQAATQGGASSRQSWTPRAKPVR